MRAILGDSPQQRPSLERRQAPAAHRPERAAWHAHKSRINGAALGVIMAIIMTHHMASTRNQWPAPHVPV